MDESQISAWASQAITHWKEFQPTRYKALKEAGKLRAAAQEAARLTAVEMDQLTEAGFQEHEAWEMVREQYLFVPEEEALKMQRDSEPCASPFAEMFNEIMMLKTAATNPTVELMTKGGKLSLRDLLDEE